MSKKKIEKRLIEHRIKLGEKIIIIFLIKNNIILN